MKNIMLSLVKDFKAMRTWLNDDRFNDNVFQLGDYTTRDGLMGIGYDKELRSLSDIESYVDEKLQSTCGISLSRIKYGVSSEGSFGAIVYFEDLPEIEYKPTFRITHGLYVNLFSKINSNYGRGCETVECNGYKGICIYSGDYSLSNEQAVEIINIALMQLATVALDNVEYGVNNTGGRAVIYFKDLPTR